MVATAKSLNIAQFDGSGDTVDGAPRRTRVPNTNGPSRKKLRPCATQNSASVRSFMDHVGSCPGVRASL